MLAPASADLQSGRIILRVSLAHLLACRQIAGCSWDGTLKAWSYPATASTARTVRSKIRPLQASAQFDAAFPVGGSVIKTPPTPAPAAVSPGPAPVVEAEIAMPPGVLTRPWLHQEAAYRFVLAHFASGLHGVLLAMGMGTGKSLVACMLVIGLAARRVLIAAPLRVIPRGIGHGNDEFSVDPADR